MPLINEGTDLAQRFGSAGGQTIVNADSPLTRLNYFDGKFLRADDLRREQSYLRQLVQFSNQGLGAGVVYGMDTVLDRQGRLSIGSGLAHDSTGRTLLISGTAVFDVGMLIDATRRIARPAAPSRQGSAAFGPCIDATTGQDDGLAAGASLYLVCVGHAESLCGIEDVYGRLCEEACVTATDRPLIVEGVVVRLLPLTLRSPLPVSRAVALDGRHLRSRVAAAWFEDERRVVGSLISAAGLALDTWCLGADASAVGCVPLAVLARAGNTTVFLDAWTTRRERIEAPARRYWAWRMAMRPWDVFLAHVLQFQCQLHEVLGGTRVPGEDDDPCRRQGQLLAEAEQYLASVEQSYQKQVERLARPAIAPAPALDMAPPGGLASLTALRTRLADNLRAGRTAPTGRVLIEGGIIELPSAGYLPVVPGSGISINTQVRRLLGEGLDLRFCVVRPDYVAHALEEAQHMERISLLQGLDDPNAKAKVDILVPDGEVVTARAPTANGWDTALSLNVGERAERAAAGQTPVALHGAGRSERLPGGGAAFHFAGAQEVHDANRFIRFVRDFATLNVATLEEREKVLRRMPTGEAADVSAARIAPNVISRIGTLAAGVAAGEAATPVATGWVSMQIQADPFALQVAETTLVSLDVLLSMLRGERRVLMRAQVNGNFRLTQPPVPSGDKRTARGQMSGLMHLTTLVGESTVADSSRPIVADVEITLTGDAASGSLAMSLIDSGRRRFGYQLEGSWSGTPTTARVRLAGGLVREGLFEAVAGNPPPTFASAQLTRSSNALEIGSELRTLSTTAIEALGRELGDPGAGFADAATRTLFPPPPPPTEELTVRGTLDWVLFHRRRTKECAVAVERPAPPPAAKYQVYHYRIRELAEVKAIREALRTPTGITQFEFERVAIVEYPAAQAILLSDIASDWQRVAPANTLAYAAIATAGDEDTPPLEQARLTRLAGTLAPGTQPDASTALEPLKDVPAALQVPGVDGMVFVVTRQVVNEECQRVFAVRNMDIWKRIQSLLTRTSPEEATAEFINKNVSPFLREVLFELGRPRFDSDSGKPLDETQLPALAPAWNAEPVLKGLAVAHRAVWLPPGDPSAARHEVEAGAVEEAMPVAAAITRETVASRVAPVDVALGEENPQRRCSVVTFLVAAHPLVVTRNAMVIVASVEATNHFPGRDAPVARVKFVNNVPDEDTLKRFIRSLPEDQPVNGITLAAITPPLDDADVRVRTIVDELGEAGRPKPSRRGSSKLSGSDRQRLMDTGHAIEGFDEVIFLERN
jgi:hypothetical protein